jgi:hypothetical protein
MPLYNAKSQMPSEFVVTKFDDDLNVESSYLLLSTPEGLVCECPAGVRPSCRHRDMLPLFVKYNRVNSNWVLDWDGGKEWRQYVGPLDTEVEGDGSEEQDESPVEEMPGEVTDPAGYIPFGSDEPIAAAYASLEPKPVTDTPFKRRAL